MVTINLPAGTTSLYLDELAGAIADALVPYKDGQSEDGYKNARSLVFDELALVANSGELRVRHPTTLGLITPKKKPTDSIDRLFFSSGIDLLECVVSVADIAAYVADRGISVSVEAPEQTAATPAPVVTAKPDVTLLATREQLIDAFGAFTGMDATWFGNIKDTPALLAARKVTGQGGRGHIAVPLFCPFEVLQWMIDPARRKGRKLGQDKGWQLFEGHFPRTYAAFSVGDPRTD